MTLLHRAYRLFRSEGAGAVASGARKKILARFDPIYQRTKPEYKRYSVGDASAEFDMSRRRLGRHDFADDIRSERSLIERVLSAVEADDVFYDVGANVGIYSCLVGSRLGSGHVVAFEPTPDAYNVLRRNVDRNDAPVETFNVALSDTNGTTRMAVNGRTGHQFADGRDGTLEIETRRGDDLVSERDLRPPNVCKIDIEGAEYLALEGLRETLNDPACRRVFCEIHTEKIREIGGSADEVETLFRELGFELKFRGDRRANYFIEASRSAEHR
ncbi:methyltransferase FkbM family [Haloterrigena turkmenica DSM 5511]|uniref:Methyltransferase FkbM family n=1 Tax=Haloterrigena turkmenica (strain ATCC 51198 / DSM 5511 / JCM 9101 / NCIMB 13204 / VKM B-1734 / 4k) TaxID=543526 RepID=D2RY75_HALTV|nr:FkbM family methyltransferase [Haloterrigena turkmenica]ADB61821.1 methyltransferase FkbM family [Haloterrigena turkmenica DSM 5511]